MGSPRPNGNTAELCKPFIEELRQHKAEVEYITLHDKNIAPCVGCYHCQKVKDDYGCIQTDDMQAIIEKILWADILVFATPIYTWQATPHMKAVMDRMYGLNKFYGKIPRSTLNKGQSYALIATCGYDLDHGAGLLDEGVRRWCTHSGLDYLGMYAVRDKDNLASFQTHEAIQGARQFAQHILEKGIDTKPSNIPPGFNTRELSLADLHPDLLQYFNRHQEVRRCLRKEGGNWVLKDISFTEEWDIAVKKEIVEKDFTDCIKSSGTVWGVFNRNKALIAFACLPSHLFGSKNQYLQLMQIHVSSECRNNGLGKMLFELCTDKARNLGAKKLYISTHSSEESQYFYTKIGCVDAEEINEKLAKLEPYDRQMEFVL